jgi:hypothetical protein
MQVSRKKLNTGFVLTAIGLGLYLVIKPFSQRSKSRDQETPRGASHHNVQDNIEAMATKLRPELLDGNNVTPITNSIGEEAIVEEILFPNMEVKLPQNTAAILGNAIKTFLYVDQLIADVPPDQHGRINQLQGAKKILFVNDYSLATHSSRELPVEHQQRAFDNLSVWATNDSSVVQDSGNQLSTQAGSDKTLR